MSTLIGKSMPRIGSVDKAMGLAKYTTDIALPGMLYGKALRSPYAHARILSIDTSKAEKDTRCKGRGDGHQGHATWRSFGIIPHTRDHVLLPFDKVRYVGEEVAAVAAIDEDTAEEAIEAIKVEYEPLPFVLTWRDAMKEGAPLCPREPCPEHGRSLSRQRGVD